MTQAQGGDPSDPIHVACYLLVDERGWLLLQERDEHAPRGAGQWAVPGGQVEGEESWEDAAYRELTEETGLRLTRGHLYLWRDRLLHEPEEPAPLHFHVYVARVDGITDADVVLGEGRRIVFVEPDVARGLDLTVGSRLFLDDFLDSEDYAYISGVRRGTGGPTGSGPPDEAAGDEAAGGEEVPAPARDSDHRFSSIVLVDRRGWVLLQERDSNPVIDPDKWSFVGGHVEEGEEDEPSAHRELLEETGLTAELALFDRFDVWHEHRPGWSVVTLWVGATEATDADVVLGEGRQIVFVDPATIDGLDLSATARTALPTFLASPEYAALRDR